jgi:hypothetical protein
MVDLWWIATLTCIVLLLTLLSALVAYVPSAAQSPAFSAGASKKEAMDTGVQAVASWLLLVMRSLTMKRSTDVSRPLGIGAFGIGCETTAFIASITRRREPLCGLSTCVPRRRGG